MSRFWCILLSFVCLASACKHRKERQEVLKKSHVHALGSSTLTITETNFPPRAPHIFIRLHDNETTAGQAALQVGRQRGGGIISIENSGNRIAGFQLQNERFRFDPNRIFTEEGRNNTLKVFGRHSEAAVQELKSLSAFILQLIPASAHIIALHNNSNNEYSVTDYNSKLKTDARSFHINPAMDPDDFVFTTNSACFEHLKRSNINAVLQDNERVKDDGSLSVFMAGRGRSYANIEAEFGHLKEQVRMTEAVLAFTSPGKAQR